jgi:Flp pilus assembly protein TadD
MHSRSIRNLCLMVICLSTLTGCAKTRQLVQNPFTYPARQRAVKYNMAQVAEREGQLRTAAEQYQALMAKDRKDHRYPHRLGVVQLRLGEHAEGVANLEHAAKLKPTDADVLNDLGFAYLEAGELKAAEEQFRAALSLNPNDKRAINNLGLCAGFDGRLEEAYQLFRRVGSEAEAQANVAYILVQRGEIPRALERYNRALTLNPELRPAAEALVQLAQLQLLEDPAKTPVKVASHDGETPERSVRQAVMKDADAFHGVDAAVSESPSTYSADPTLGLSTP